MSRDRTLKNAGFVNPSQLPKGPGGRPLCRWCGQETKPPRRTFCSDPCVREHQIRSNPGYARKLVGQRDRGVCAVCHVDTKRLKRAIDRVESRVGPHTWFSRQRFEPIRSLKPHQQTETIVVKYKKVQLSIQEKYSWAFSRTQHKVYLRSHLWEMDHIIPVAEGGGSCGLENLRSLCIACHLQATRELRKRLAAKKKLP